MKKQRFVILFSAALVISFGAAMVSCGGGGGSSSNLLYTGETSQAIISQTNAVGILTDAYMGGDMGSFPVPLGAVRSDEGLGSKGSTVFNAAMVMKEAVSQIDRESLINDPAVGITQSQTINGSCGGSASFSISFNEITGAFSGNFTFNAYNECTDVISGGISISGVFEIVQGPQGPEPGELITLTMSFSALAISGGETATIAGEITVTVNPSSESIIMDVLLHDGVTDKTYWVNNYSITVAQGAGFTDVTVSGSFYDPDEGFVTLSTPVPLHILDFDEWPSGGTLEVAGLNGTKARLIVIDSTEFYVLVESGNDNLFDEWDSRDFGQLFWADF
jgi:hypothetical protein